MATDTPGDTFAAHVRDLEAGPIERAFWELAFCAYVAVAGASIMSMVNDSHRAGRPVGVEAEPAGSAAAAGVLADAALAEHRKRWGR